MKWLAPLIVAALAQTVCQAQSHSAPSQFCDQTAKYTLAEQDKLLRFSQLIKSELDNSDLSVALISRSGLDLSRFNTRYSHAGYSLKDSPNTAWSVRQLYYACEDARPKIFDQGMAGFIAGTDSPKVGFISVVLLPKDKAIALAATALDKAQALALLHPNYSANAYAFSEKYQNCNQWVAELLAASLANNSNGNLSRAAAQRWLKDNNYQPSVMRVDSRLLMLAGAFIPYIHSDDHPVEDLHLLQYRVSMPQAIEQWVQKQTSDAQRIEFCYNEKQLVVRYGWRSIEDGCVAAPGDKIVLLSD
jgi:hypothetical protein